MVANACDTTGNSLSPAQAYLLGVDLVSPFLCRQGTCQEGQDAAAVEDAEDQENAKSKAYWVDEEETVLTKKYGRLRQAGVMCGVATVNLDLCARLA